MPAAPDAADWLRDAASGCEVPYLGCSLPAGFTFRFVVEHPFWFREEAVPFEGLPSALVGGRGRQALVTAAQRGELVAQGIEGPIEGRVPDDVARAVNTALDRAGEPEVVCAAVWDGWLGVGGSLPPGSPSVDLGTRRYHLVELRRPLIQGIGAGPFSVAPSCVWDAAHRWVVAVDVDDSCSMIATVDGRLADLLGDALAGLGPAGAG